MGRFTPEDLLQYLYHETSPEQTAAIEAAIENDWSLKEQLDVMISGQKQLEDVNFSPRESVLKKIIDYSEKDINELHTH